MGGKSKLKAKSVVCLVLRNIGSAECFAILGLEFGISEPQASRLFAKYLPGIARKMKQLIFWSSKEVSNNLCPLEFRNSFRDLETIIDCFEIQIQNLSFRRRSGICLCTT